MAGAPIMKDGDLRSEVYLAFVRRQPCAFCTNRGGVAHHFPPRGRGVTRDDQTAPSCVGCHGMCHGIGGSISEERQHLAVLVAFRDFFDMASESERTQFMRDFVRWQESRVFRVAL